MAQPPEEPLTLSLESLEPELPAWPEELLLFERSPPLASELELLAALLEPPRLLLELLLAPPAEPPLELPPRAAVPPSDPLLPPACVLALLVPPWPAEPVATVVAVPP